MPSSFNKEKGDRHFRSIVKMVKLGNDEDDEKECLLVKRANRMGATIIVPIDLLWVFVDDADGAYQRFATYCDQMWGRGGWSKGDLMNLSRHIGSRLDDLIQVAPKEESRDEYEEAMNRMGVQLRGNGEVLLDYQDKGPKRAIYMPRASNKKKVH